MKERVTLSLEEQRRLMVLNRVERGGVVGRQAAEILGISLRHLRRLMAAYRKEGARAEREQGFDQEEKHDKSNEDPYRRHV